jgi:hypothetical protein
MIEDNRQYPEDEKYPIHFDFQTILDDPCEGVLEELWRPGPCQVGYRCEDCGKVIITNITSDIE